MSRIANGRIVLVDPRRLPSHFHGGGWSESDALADAADSVRQSPIPSEGSLSSTKVERNVTAEAENSLRQLLRTDQRSFLSGYSVVVCQAAHIIDAVSGERSQRPEKRKAALKLKAQIEHFLQELWFNGGHPYPLEGRQNLFLLRTDEHDSLARYGLFAFFPGLKRLEDIYDRLGRDNLGWNRRSLAAGGDARRALDITGDSPYNSATVDWHVLLLYPNDFAPEAISIVHPEQRYDGASPSQVVLCYPKEHTESGQLSNAVTINLLSYENGDPVKLKMDYNSPSCRRDASTEQHSLFGIIVNLHSKVAAYQKHNDTLPPGFAYVAGLLESIVDSIFFCPQNNKFAQKYPTSEHGEDRGPPALASLTAREFDLPSRPETPNEKNLTISEQFLLLKKATDPTNPNRALDFMRLLHGPQGYPNFEFLESKLLRVRAGREAGHKIVTLRVKDTDSRLPSPRPEA